MDAARLEDETVDRGKVLALGDPEVLDVHLAGGAVEDRRVDGLGGGLYGLLAQAIGTGRRRVRRCGRGTLGEQTRLIRGRASCAPSASPTASEAASSPPVTSGNRLLPIARPTSPIPSKRLVSPPDRASASGASFTLECTAVTAGSPARVSPSTMGWASARVGAKSRVQKTRTHHAVSTATTRESEPSERPARARESAPHAELVPRDTSSPARMGNATAGLPSCARAIDIPPFMSVLVLHRLSYRFS